MFQIKKDCPKLTKSCEHDFKFNIHSFNNKVVVIVVFAIPYISMRTQGWYLKFKTKGENVHSNEHPKQQLPVVENVPSNFNYVAT